jgi:hypothetical protein
MDHIQIFPQFIFFLPNHQGSVQVTACFLDTIEIVKYNSKLFAENVEIYHINDSEWSKYTFNKTPQPYKTYIQLSESYYVLEDDYHIEKFEQERNELVDLLGRLNAESVSFRETVNNVCGVNVILSGDFCAPLGGGLGEEKKKKDEMLQDNVFDNKHLSEKDIRRNFAYCLPKSKVLQEVVKRRLSGVLFDHYSFSFNDYTNVSGKLTDTLSGVLGISCNREYSRKVTYEYTIKYYPYASPSNVSKHVSFEDGVVYDFNATSKVCDSIFNHTPFCLWPKSNCIKSNDNKRSDKTNEKCNEKCNEKSSDKSMAPIPSNTSYEMEYII